MKIPIYQVDAFTDTPFKGNPAAVCPLDAWPEDKLLLNIARENNLSETAFFVKKEDEYELRWFTPEAEVDLCGHATMAASYVIANKLEQDVEEINYNTESGKLRVVNKGDRLSMFFPSRPAEEFDDQSSKDIIREALEIEPDKILKSTRDYLVLYSSKKEIENINPDMRILEKLPGSPGIIVSTATPDLEYDFISRFFAPALGVPEDPVTGSAHCVLIPHWSDELNKDDLLAYQDSNRGGELKCSDLGERVELSGQAVIYLEGQIKV